MNLKKVALSNVKTTSDSSYLIKYMNYVLTGGFRLDQEDQMYFQCNCEQAHISKQKLNNITEIFEIID